MSVGIEIAKRPRKCAWCPEKIIPGQACLVFYYMKSGCQLCEECTRKAYLIISKQTDFEFKFNRPHPDFLKKL